MVIGLLWRSNLNFDDFSKIVINVFSKSKYLKKYSIKKNTNCIIYQIKPFELVVSLDNFMEVGLRIRRHNKETMVLLKDIVQYCNFMSVEFNCLCKNQFRNYESLVIFLKENILIIDRVIEVLIINPQLFEDCYIANKNKCKELYQNELNQNHNKKLDVYWKEKKYSDFCDFYEKAILMCTEFQINELNLKRLRWIKATRQLSDGSMIDSENGN